MDKVFLLDAYALIYRAYYAFIKNPRINSKGLNTSAILGFCNTLHEVMEKEKPTHLAVAFDPHGPTFRSEAFPAYKAQREETPEDIRASVPIIKDVLKAMNIPILQVDGFEADDVIGTMATMLRSSGVQESGSSGVQESGSSDNTLTPSVYMLTPDKDYGQLVGGNVFIYRPRHGGGYEVMDEKAVCEKYGIERTEQVIDLLALMGDSADNFPGCPGVGEKTAVKLITQFGTVENLLQHTDQIKGKLREKVEAAVDDIKMSHFLATIRTEVPLSFSLEDIKMAKPNEAELAKIFNELEFRTLLNKFLSRKEERGAGSENTAKLQQPDLFGLFAEEAPGGEYATVAQPSTASSLSSTVHDYHLVETEADAQTLLQQLLSAEAVSLDTETTSTNAIDAELVGLSFAVKEHEAWYVAIPAEREKAQRMVDIFRPVYESSGIVKVGQNIKYDLEVLRNYGIRLAEPMWDTMIAHYLIQPELRHNMDFMAETLLGYKTIHIDELIGPKGKNQRSMRDLPPQEVYEYACEDADITLQLKNKLEPLLQEKNVAELFHEIEMPLVSVLAEMEMNGVCLDTASLKETSAIFTERM
ncbi:MAG: DNA polymerase I, partial [Bacteroidaceae bacterium]|nr:DNA polymerase I [Bacteroidaceae bacterium]